MRAKHSYKQKEQNSNFKKYTAIKEETPDVDFDLYTLLHTCTNVITHMSTHTHWHTPQTHTPHMERKVLLIPSLEDYPL